MEKYPEVFPLRITTQMYRWVKGVAEREYSTISHVLRRLIREAMERDKEK